MHDVMIDIETLGTKPGCIVLSVGVVQFDVETGDTGRNFYCRPNPYVQQSRGLGIDYGTLEWWMEQGPGAQSVFQEPTESVGDMVHGIKWACEEARTFWSQGSNFDFPILEAMINAFYPADNSPVPWSFYQIRDTRVIYDLAKRKTGFNYKSVKRSGDHHNAIDDAYHQVMCVNDAWNELIK